MHKAITGELLNLFGTTWLCEATLENTLLFGAVLGSWEN